MMPSTKRSGRVGSTKSKTGCDTCKMRRIRCSEERPRCVRCTSTGRQCSYASSVSKMEIIGSLTSQITRFSHPAARERRAFEYYFHQAGPALSGALDFAFWRGSVMQICRQEPAVWDAIIALSALYERPPIHESTPFALVNSPTAVRHAHHREALVWYSRSLIALQQRIDQGVADMTVLLITCILFIAIELLQGNRKAALSLYKQGAQMMVRATRSTGNLSDLGICIDREFLFSAIEPIYRRLGTWVLINNGDLEDSLSLYSVSLDERFTSIDDARNALCGIVAQMKSLDLAIHAHWMQPRDTRMRKVIALSASQRKLDARLCHWYRRFWALKYPQNSTAPPVTDQNTGEAALLYMIYLSVLIEVKTCLSTDQAAYDDYELEFTRILASATTAIAATRNSNGQQPAFMFEMGVFLPLFITALKCRNPQLRRQALRYMCDAPPAQGLFMCGPTAYVVALIVALEENSVTIPQKATDIWGTLSEPGCQPVPRDRIWNFSISSDTTKDGEVLGWLHYRLRDCDCEEEVRFVERTVPFPG